MTGGGFVLGWWRSGLLKAARVLLVAGGLLLDVVTEEREGKALLVALAALGLAALGVAL